MHKLLLVLFLGCLTGCNCRRQNTPEQPAPSDSAKASLSFREQQERLFHGIDHKLVYQSCQELLRQQREGKLSAETYYRDDPPAKLSALPEPIRALQPTSVQVDELMVRMIFLSEDGMQHLECISNEFGEPGAPEDNVKGLGFRKDPYGMDRLSGTESLDHLNATYSHFHVALIPGLTYQVFKEDSPRTLDQVKQMNEGMGKMFEWVQQTVNELAVKKQRLLHRTDHHALLAACRELMKRCDEGEFTERAIRIMPAELLENLEQTEREKYDQDLRLVPEILLGLEPGTVHVAKDRVDVVLIGGFDHAGVFAYRNDSDAVPRDDDMELVPGLRYYDDGLRESGEDWREYLKSLEYEALSPNDWRRKQMNLPLPKRD